MGSAAGMRKMADDCCKNANLHGISIIIIILLLLLLILSLLISIDINSTNPNNPNALLTLITLDGTKKYIFRHILQGSESVVK